MCLAPALATLVLIFEDFHPEVGIVSQEQKFAWCQRLRIISVVTKGSQRPVVENPSHFTKKG